jgi:predicted nucleotidyltransferase
MIETEYGAVPERFRADLARAVQILKEEGCTEIFLFGSGAAGNLRDSSDLDLAIRGCPRGRFFHLLGRLLRELEHPVDLVNLDTQDPFGQFLQQEGGLVQVG